MWPNPQLTTDLVTFTEEILNGKLHFCAVIITDKMEKDWEILPFLKLLDSSYSIPIQGFVKKQVNSVVSCFPPKETRTDAIVLLLEILESFTFQFLSYTYKFRELHIFGWWKWPNLQFYCFQNYRTGKSLAFLLKVIAW